MRTPELKSTISAALLELKSHADELRDLDGVLGDGDLGITVSAGADAVVAALADLGDDVTPSDVARAAAKAFANANPSTMAALVAGGLLAGAKTWTGLEDIDVAATAAFTRAGGEAIAQRGKTQLGDKTVLDAIFPAAEALQDGKIGDAIAAAERGVKETKDMQSRRGRAAWLQERSIGLQDPGATAFLRFLESWERVTTEVAV